MKSKANISLEDFEAIFGERASEYFKVRFNKYHFEYEELERPTQESICIQIIEKLLSEDFIAAGEHRKTQWESGWEENLIEYRRSENPDVRALTPKYFRKENKILRWKSNFIRPISDGFEYDSLGVLLDWIFDKYSRSFRTIYEFGCGPAHHLLRCMEINPGSNYWGLDWAISSQLIINEIRRRQNVPNLRSANFNYFEPDYSFDLEPNSLVYTAASLEQIGSSWRSFVDYLIKKRPGLCVHVEPVEEVLDRNNLVDYLSIRYFKKRNYLSGFLTGLREMEMEGRIKIERVIRTHIGSFFIEGYTIIIWRPIAR